MPRISDASVTNIGTLQATDCLAIDRVGDSSARKTTPADLKTYIATSETPYTLFDITPGGVPTTEGVISWNSEHHTLNIQPDNANVLLQVGQEEWIHVYNQTGATIPDGAAVYITGPDTGHPSIALAKADNIATASVIGLATAAIPNLSYGYVTCRGTVKDYDTSGFTAPSTLWLSATTAGALTETMPIPDNYAVPVAVTITSDVAGLVYVLVGNPSASIAATQAAIASGDPTGFVNNDAITVSYDSTTRTITLTGDLEYVWRGARLSLASPWISTAHSGTTGVSYFLSSNDGINFTWSTTPWEFDVVMVAYVFYGTTDKFAIREPHGTMGWQTHEELHDIIGTYKKSGGAVSSYTLASTTSGFRRPSVASTVIKDEDTRTTNAELTNDLFTQIFLTGTTPTNDFLVDQAEIVPVLANNPYYNSNTAGTWGQTLMANNSYSSIWLIGVPTTSDVTSQKYRFIWMQGQTNGTLAAEQALTPALLELGGARGVFSELCFMAQIIIRFTGGNWDIVSVKDLTRRVAL